MMQRLMHPPHVLRRQARRHRFYTLALPGKQESLAVVLQRNGSIHVGGRLRQAIEPSRQALLSDTEPWSGCVQTIFILSCLSPSYPIPRPSGLVQSEIMSTFAVVAQLSHFHFPFCRHLDA